MLSASSKPLCTLFKTVGCDAMSTVYLGIFEFYVAFSCIKYEQAPVDINP